MQPGLKCIFGLPIQGCTIKKVIEDIHYLFKKHTTILRLFASCSYPNQQKLILERACGPQHQQVLGTAQSISEAAVSYLRVEEVKTNPILTQARNDCFGNVNVNHIFNDTLINNKSLKTGKI